mmetsp:Transcript_3833/g.3574  ORF Transcript_3833/g.3574 Transcript_3833/m.3574 type:complete len:294 (-) Transcript_3833:119-1000(-)
MLSQPSEDLQPFDINSPAYPQNTYTGRLLNLVNSQNSFNFFLPHSRVVQAKVIVDEEKKKAQESNGQPILYKSQKIKEIRRAQSIVDSSYHPDTGEIVPRMLRLCSYAPASIPVMFGMLLSQPTTFNIILWQWLNQTYSAGVNYSNRNASSTLTTKDISTAYVAAVSTSVGIGLGVKALLNPIAKKLHGPSKIFINVLISLSAIGSAGFLNLLIMRSKEIQNGISLIDHEGNDRGKSRIIGKSAVVNTALTRFLMPVPPILSSTLVFYYMEKKSLNPKNKWARMMLEAVVFFF